MPNNISPGKPDHWGTYISDYRMGYHDDYRNEYPMHWPATQRRLENAAEWSKQFNDMVDENSWNQKLLGFSAQQGVRERPAQQHHLRLQRPDDLPP